MMYRNILLFVLGYCSIAPAWGELGHHLVGKLSAKLLVHSPRLVAKYGPEKLEKDSQRKHSFLHTFYEKRLMLGHLGNIPDTYWRGLDKKLTALGDPTHYFNREVVLEMESPVGFAIKIIPTDYATLKRLVKKDKPKIDFFKTVGSLPWRAQQFASLYETALKQLPKVDCKRSKKTESDPIQEVLTYAGLLSHFTADASVPLHATKFYDGTSPLQKGLHSYWESELVNGLEEFLEKKVWDRAIKLSETIPLQEKSNKLYPQVEKQNRVTAKILTLLEDSATFLGQIEEADRKFALKNCDPTEKGVCRRSPHETINGKTIAEWNEALIVERLAIASVVTADIWAELWLEAGAPDLCFTWGYALKPAFVPPSVN